MLISLSGEDNEQLDDVRTLFAIFVDIYIYIHLQLLRVFEFTKSYYRRRAQTWVKLPVGYF
jgi:hypothetical protein